MKKRDIYLVIEALRSAQTELQTLIDEDMHVPSGLLMEQIDEALEILEGEYAGS